MVSQVHPGNLTRRDSPREGLRPTRDRYMYSQSFHRAPRQTVLEVPVRDHQEIPAW